MKGAVDNFLQALFSTEDKLVKDSINAVLDNIRDEIESMDFDFGDYYDHTNEIKEMVCKVLDKYKAESEAV